MSRRLHPREHKYRRDHVSYEWPNLIVNDDPRHRLMYPVRACCRFMAESQLYMDWRGTDWMTGNNVLSLPPMAYKYVEDAKGRGRRVSVPTSDVPCTCVTCPPAPEATATAMGRGGHPHEPLQ